MQAFQLNNLEMDLKSSLQTLVHFSSFAFSLHSHVLQTSMLLRINLNSSYSYFKQYLRSDGLTTRSVD